MPSMVSAGLASGDGRKIGESKCVRKTKAARFARPAFWVARDGFLYLLVRGWRIERRCCVDNGHGPGRTPDFDSFMVVC